MDAVLYIAWGLAAGFGVVYLINNLLWGKHERKRDREVQQRITDWSMLRLAAGSDEVALDADGNMTYPFAATREEVAMMVRTGRPPGDSPPPTQPSSAARLPSRALAWTDEATPMRKFKFGWKRTSE